MDAWTQFLKKNGSISEDIAAEIMNRIKFLPRNKEAKVAHLIEDCLTTFPWNVIVKPVKDISSVLNVLDRRLFGMNDVKNKIRQSLILSTHSSRSVFKPLILVGPPGTGKTTVAKSIAAAVRLPFSALSFASSKDPTLYKGHQSTWAGAAPGLLLTEVIRAKCLNPVLLLDEIDKTGSGSAFSAGNVIDLLTELMDPAQASVYRDNFLQVPVDLSHIFLIATANNESAIPAYIIDRADIIHIRDYTEDERFAIIKNYLPVEIVDEDSYRFKVTISDDIAVWISRQNKSLRTAKRIIRELLAEKLFEMQAKGMYSNTKGNNPIFEVFLDSTSGTAPLVEKRIGFMSP